MTPITVANESILLLLINIRHYEHLLRAKTALMDVQNSLDAGITNDFWPWN